MRNPSARAVEAAATEEILRRLETEVDKRFQDVATKLRATNGALSALDGEVQGHVEKTASQMKVLQEDNKNLKENTASQLKSLKENTAAQLKALKESLRGELESIRGKIAEPAANARQSRGRSASANMLSPNVERPFKMPKFAEQKTRASTGVA